MTALPVKQVKVITDPGILKGLQDQIDAHARLMASLVPTNVLQPGQSLFPNVRLKSPSKNAYAILQSDGNFVLYATEGNRPMWATGTQGHQVSAVNMQSDGNFVLVDKSGAPVWASATNGHPASTLTVQDDGNMVLYDPNHNGVWSSETYGFSNHHEGHGLFDYIDSATGSLVDAITSIPGVEFAAGQIQDFANTGVGKTFLRGVSSYLVPIMFTVNPGLGIVASSALGAALGTSAFIAPGLLRGEPIDVALLNESKSAAEKFGAQFEDQLPAAAQAVEDWGTANGIDFDKLANEGIDIRNLIAHGIDASTLAAIAHVPPEVAQIAIDAATRTQTASTTAYDSNGHLLPVGTKKVQFINPNLLGPGGLPVKAVRLLPGTNINADGLTLDQVAAKAAGAVAPPSPAHGITPPEPKPSPAPSPGKVSASNNLLVAGGCVAIGLLLVLTKK